VTNYYIKVPQGHGELALDILADMLTNSLLDPAELDRERNVIIQEMKMRILDDPAGQAAVLVPGLIWPGNPMSNETIGSAEVINNIPQSAVAAYWQKHYQPRNMVVSVAGKVDHADVVAQVQGLMGQLADTEPQAYTPVTTGISDDLSAGVDKDCAQAQLFIAARAYRSRHAEDPAARILTGILGHGLSSRLFISVREQKGLAYTVSASLQNFVDTGIFEVYAGVNPEQAEEALEAGVSRWRWRITR
jgi:predicted Zn-dependent peptidase